MLLRKMYVYKQDRQIHVYEQLMNCIFQVHFNLISVTNAKIVDSKINGINIQEMVSDALLRKHANQVNE